MADDQATINKILYIVSPTMEQIDSFIDLCRVSELQFERFFAIPKETITKVRQGYRPMPAKYWHIFYERKIPVYGPGYLKAISKKVMAANSKGNSRGVTFTPPANKDPLPDSNHDRLGNLK